MTSVAQALIDRGWDSLDHLATVIGPREAGSPHERVAAEYIADAFRTRGLTTHYQRFRYVGWEPVSLPRVEVRFRDGTSQSLQCAPMAYTGSTPAGGVQGFLKADGVCELVPGLLEWPRFAVDLNGAAGAYIAVVPGGRARPFPRPDRQLLLEPIVIVGSDQFEEIDNRLRRGEPIQASVETHGRYVPDYESVNVVAELPGACADTVIVSAHYDTVANTPGAGDNASGVAACLALAEHYAARNLSRSLRFIAWGAHEFGLLGSQAYVQDLAQHGELDGIQAAVALDVLSDGTRLGVWVGEPRLLDQIRGLDSDIHTDVPIEYYPRGRGETDTWSFAERGIDTVMLLTLPFSHFHLPEDTTANNSKPLFTFSVRVAERIVEHLLMRPASQQA